MPGEIKSVVRRVFRALHSSGRGSFAEKLQAAFLNTHRLVHYA